MAELISVSSYRQTPAIAVNTFKTLFSSVVFLTPRQRSGTIRNEVRRRVCLAPMEQTLLLNASYEPLKIVHWQKAMTLWCQGKVEVISSTTGKSAPSRSASSCPPSSACCATSKSSGRFDYVPFSRANIYARDDTRASTAARRSRRAELTFDHVVPVAQGGRKDWENIVTCCVSCNRRKGGRTPDEAGMRMMRPPQTARVGAGHPDHDWLAKRARQLARLLVLERRARRHLTTLRFNRQLSPLRVESWGLRL